jgi:hypothetical protein
MVIAADCDEILGFTAFAAEASELMAAVQVAMIARMPYPALRAAIFTHPTAAEGLTALLAWRTRIPAPVTQRTAAGLTISRPTRLRPSVLSAHPRRRRAAVSAAAAEAG